MSWKDHCQLKYFRYQNFPSISIVLYVKTHGSFWPNSRNSPFLLLRDWIFFFDLFLNCFSCKALQSSARHHSLCCSPLGKKKSASVSQNLVKYSETTKEIALCMNPARDHCVRQFNFERRQKEDTCRIIL